MNSSKVSGGGKSRDEVNAKEEPNAATPPPPQKKGTRNKRKFLISLELKMRVCPGPPSHSTYDDEIRPFCVGGGGAGVPCSKGFASRIQVFFFCPFCKRYTSLVFSVFSPVLEFFASFSSFRPFVCPLLKTLCVCQPIWVTFPSTHCYPRFSSGLHFYIILLALYD